MAWTYNQNFNGLSTAALGGQDSWTATGGSSFASVSETSTHIYEGAKGVACVPGTAGNYRRSITNTTTGDVYWAMKYGTANASGDGVNVSLKRGSNYGLIVKFAQVSGTNKLQYFNGSAYVDLVASAVTDTWYIVHVQYDTAGGGNGKYYIEVNAGGLSAQQTFYQNVASGIDTVELAIDSLWTGSFDTMQDTNPAAGSASVSPSPSSSVSPSPSPSSSPSSSVSPSPSASPSSSQSPSSSVSSSVSSSPSASQSPSSSPSSSVSRSPSSSQSPSSSISASISPSPSASPSAGSPSSSFSASISLSPSASQSPSSSPSSSPSASQSPSSSVSKSPSSSQSPSSSVSASPSPSASSIWTNQSKHTSIWTNVNKS
jgi:hypothetical protein